MAIRVLRADERPAMAWKNGGGVTREVARDPADARMADFIWRVSVAEVAEGGPFSAFEGVDRVITVVDGAGMVLTLDGSSHPVEPFAPFAFSGDVDTDCQLVDGPLVDFNVMTRRTAATAKVELIRDRCTLPARPDTAVLAIVLAGSAELDAEGVTLGRFDACLTVDAMPGELRVDGVTAIVSLTTLDMPS